MGFISYSLNYYETELQQLESSVVTTETIYKAKQLLKMLDDLVDEGYTELNEKLEETCGGVSRLRKYLKLNKAEPFPVHSQAERTGNAGYGSEETELTEAIQTVMNKAAAWKEKSVDSFLQKLVSFCRWIGYEENTAYIFLLRDTLLPYVCYRSKNRRRIYPWLLGRKTLEILTGKNGTDDEIRASVIKALEEGKCRNFSEFCSFVLPDIRTTLLQYPEMERSLKEMLYGIKEQRIIAVESGCSGTFPLLLMSLDDRVDIRMYTTYPYLADVYKDRIFTPEYEENRLFETMFSQDVYFQFSNLRDGVFYVHQCQNVAMEEKALAEIKTIMEWS